jgi:preprotein translocase SecF subunit
MAFHIIPQKTNFKFTSKRYISIAVSLLIMLGTFALMFTKGFNYGIDFTGGILVEIKTEQDIPMSELRKHLAHASSLQQVGDDGAVMIRLPIDEHKTNQQVVAELKETLAKTIDGKIEYRKVDFVGPQVGAELIESAIIALFAAFGVLLVYVWIRFEWQYAVGAILSLMHDSVAVIGFFLVTQLEFDLTAVAAILTVVGYSINDTVVIYDRVRENMRKYKKMGLEDLIDLSINETMSRTVLTVATTILALICLVVFGGDNLQTFSQGMLFGVVIGTFSSVYVAALALFYLDPRQNEENE